MSRNASAKADRARAAAPTSTSTGVTFRESGFDPDDWGPSLWKFTHIMTANFPLKPTRADRLAYYHFFNSLRYLLPCGGCRVGYEHTVGSGPLKLREEVFRDRQTVFTWWVGVHNAVNKHVGKPVDTNARRWYQHYDRLRV